MTKLIDTFLNFENKPRRNKGDLMNNCGSHFAFSVQDKPNQNLGQVIEIGKGFLRSCDRAS